MAKIIDKPLLALLRGPGLCEYCRRFVTNREPHHLFGRGFGGARRFDIKINLISLCAEFSGGMHCHTLVHVGRIDRERLLEIVARREKTTPDAIRWEIYRLRRL